MCSPARHPIVGASRYSRYRRSGGVARAGAACAVAAMFAGNGCAARTAEVFPQPEQRIVWPAPPETPRIEWVGRLRSSEDLGAPTEGWEAVATAFRGPRPPIRFASPVAISVSRNGRVAVADVSAPAVHVLDLEERTHLRIGGFDDTPLGAPSGVTWWGDLIVATDAKLARVLVFEPGGRLAFAFGEGVLERPVGIAADESSRRLFVVDGDAHNVKTFDEDGRLLSTIGGPGSAPGQFNFPTNIALRENRLIVADSGNFRVQVLDRKGTPIAVIGREGNAAGTFALPKGVAVSPQGHVYVSDARFENVQVFDQTGNLLLAFGREGRAPGEFWLPAGLTIDRQDRIWVADTGNSRLQVFQYLKGPT